MNASKKNISINNGWILCPSKSFPGKFYYFNVLNGEAAWSLSEADKKGLKKEIPPQVHKVADKAHEYPEPNSLPDETSLTSYDIGAHVKKPDFLKNIPCTNVLPTFGQLPFPRYMTKEPYMTNIVWTPLQVPLFYPDEKKPMSDKVTQTSGLECELSIEACDIPLGRRFKNYVQPSLSFDERNMPMHVGTSTPKSSLERNKHQNGVTKSKSLIKDPVLKLDSKLKKFTAKTPDVKHAIEKPVLSLGDKVETTAEIVVPNLEESEKVLGSLEQTDLRFLLLAKRRKSMEASVETVERKRQKPNESKSTTAKKKVTFDLNFETGEGLVLSDVSSEEDFEPPPIVDTPRSPILQSKNVSHFTKDVGVPKVATPSFDKDSVLPVRKNFWYIVVDTDVLLFNHEFIEKLVLSDPTCKLVIPYAVRVDIASLCLGDCRGQQRVINARQLTRRLATPPAHYTVEPPPVDEDGIIVTSESILNCCLHAMHKNCYVVLITNDPYLESRAICLNVPSYRINDIKDGVDIKPKMTSHPKKIKTNPKNDDSDKLNQCKSKLGLFSNLTTKDTVKKQLFFNNDNNLDCDKLINITKPKYVENVDIDDDSMTSDISREVQNLNIIDKNILKPQNSNRNPFLLQDFKERTPFENRMHDSNIFNGYLSDKTIQNSKEPLHFKNVASKFDQSENYQNNENPFCSKTNSGVNHLTFNNKKSNTILNNSGICSNSKISNIYPTNTRIPNPSQSRINKIFNNITSDTKINTESTKTIDHTGTFKIPQPLQFKNRTRNASAPVESSNGNDKFRMRIDKDFIEESLKRFCVKSKDMSEKISTRIDEWVCSFMQIIDEVLNNLLVKSSVCMKNTLAPLNLHDTMHYAKMVYASHTKTRNVIVKLSEMLDICISSRGNLKVSITSEDFMKMFSYGVALVSALKNIVPTSEELNDAEFGLNALLNNIESNTKELDPELLKTPLVSRTDKDQEIRPIFFKGPSYVLDYLKKHFKVWASYNEENDNYLNNEEVNHSDFKVLRTSGKYLNLLKINRGKAICLQNAIGNDTANANKNESKIVRQTDNNQVTKSNSNVANIAEPKLIEHSKDDRKNVMTTNQIIANENDLYPKVLKKQIKINIDSTSNIKTKDTEKKIFSNVNSEIDGPKMIRNITLIDEFEKKISNREPLNLDLLDYSEIDEPSVAENPDFDVIEAENVNNNHLDDKNTYKSSNIYVETLAEDVQLESDIDNFYISQTLDQVLKTNNGKLNTENMGESITIPENEKDNFFSKSDVQKIHGKTYCDDVSDKNITLSDSCVVNDISEIRDVNFVKSAQVMDDSTIDSGFENDSTYAHSVVKIFLHELSTSFKIIFKFVTSFVDEIRVKELCDSRKNILHNQANKCLDDMVAIIQLLKSIIKRESAEDTILKTLLLKAGVEATTDKRITRYRHIVIKSLEQALILEKALKMIVATTIGDYDSVSSHAETINSSIRYFNIFE